MKKLLYLPLLIILALAGGIIWLYLISRPVSSGAGAQSFLVPKGSTASETALKLESAGIIRSALAFKIFVRITGTSDTIQTGEFRLSPSSNLVEIINELEKGPTEVWVTIPEGFRREEIAARITQGLGQNASFTSTFLSSSAGDEGMLFPDTYLIPKNATPTEIILKMQDNFRARTLGLTPRNGVSFGQSIILASLIERETKTDDERPIVAGILLNRIQAGMPLQVDSTIQYAIGTSKNWWPVPSSTDLSVASRYNTYKYQGLPPGPICNPGLSSIKAAMSPAQTDYLYYLHDTSGQIHYAKTLQEQDTNIKKYLR